MGVFSPPTHILQHHTYLGGLSGPGRTPWGQPERKPGEQGMCLRSQKVCTLSNSPLTSDPGAGNVALPTALALAGDSRHGKPKTIVPPPEARQLKVVVVHICVTLCLGVRKSLLLSDLGPPESFFTPSLQTGTSLPLSLSFCSEQWQWGCQPQKDKP